MTNPILEYSEKIQSGEIVACNKIKVVYKYLSEIILNEASEWRYDKNRANHVIDFVECFCKHSKGKWAGKPVLLELWQKAFISAIFGIIDKKTQLRRFREVFFVVGKKNGKSLMGSALANYMFIADGEGGADIYSVATKRDQAKIVWNESRSMIKKSKSLKKRVKCLVNNIAFEKMDCSYRALSSDTDTEDGLNVYMAVCDEIHAWKGSKGIDLYNIVENGISAREEPLILATTTAGFEREGIFDLKYDISEKVINGYFDDCGFKRDSFLPIIYELDNRSEWDNEDCWVKSNPNLGVSKKISYLRDKVAEAKEVTKNKKTVLTKEFNIRETSTEVWLNFDEVDNRETFDLKELKPPYAFGGADLSKNTDLTSACILFSFPESEKIYVESMYWLPADLLSKRSREDSIPYDIWAERGFLRLSKGNKVDYDDVVKWFDEVQNELDIYLYEWGYDAWSAAAFVKKMNDNFGDIGHAVYQGKRTLSGAMAQLGAEIRSKNVIYNDNPITKWCLTNVRADIDKNANMQPAKPANCRRRIDGFAAMLNAYVKYLDDKDDYFNLF